MIVEGVFGSVQFQYGDGGWLDFLAPTADGQGFLFGDSVQGHREGTLAELIEFRDFLTRIIQEVNGQ